jgi:phenylalanyl-tRNA synthetase beta subunit
MRVFFVNVSTNISAEILIGGLACAALSGCGIAAPSHGEGVADLESLDLSEYVSETTSFSLGPTPLSIAAWFMDGESEKLLLRELDGVRVKIFEISGDVDAVAAKLRELSATLQSQNWDPIVRVKDEGEQADILVRVSAETIQGLVVLVLDDKEAVVVNVIGELQPELLAEALTALDIDIPGISGEAT